jgi:hypothetical protein
MATPPTAPIIYFAPQATSQTLEYQWTAPINPGTPSTITTYRLQIYDSTGTLVLQQTVSGSTLYYKATGLINGELYSTTIDASNDSGVTYGPTASFRQFSPGSSAPSAPATASATMTAPYTTAIVAWTPPSTLPDSTIYWYVIVSSSTDSLDPVIKRTANGLTQSSLQITGLNPNSRYTFSVRAVNCPGYSPPTITNSVGNPFEYNFTVSAYESPSIYAFTFINPGDSELTLYQMSLRPDNSNLTRLQLSNYYLPSNDTAWVPTSCTGYNLASEVEVINPTGYRSVVYLYSAGMQLSDSIGQTRTIDLKYWYPTNSNVIEYIGITATRVADI